MTLVAYLKPAAGHVHEHFRCCSACHRPTEPARGVRHCPYCCRDVGVDAEGRTLEHRGPAPYRWCLGGFWRLPERLDVELGSGKRLTLAQAEEAIDLTLERRFPLDLKTRELRYYVMHWRAGGDYTPRTYVEAVAFSRRGEDGKVARTRYRFNRRAGAILGEMPDVAEHPHGVCGPCTVRFRYSNGLGLDVADVAAQPGYAPTLLDVAFTGSDLIEPPAGYDAAVVARIERDASFDSKSSRRPSKRDIARELFT